MKRSIFKKWTFIPIALLFSTIIYKLVSLSVILNKNSNQFRVDFSVIIPRLYFLAEYGFHKFVPLWYNGFELFKFYPPGWYYFTLPLVYLTNNVFLATYISIIILFVLIFFLLYLFGRREKLQRNEILLFYGFLLGNAWFLTSITDGGRVADLFSWCVFISLALLIYYYKNHRFDKYFILLILLTSLLLLAHIYFFMMGLILISCLFFYKPFKEKIILALCMISSLFITSFWWIEFTQILDEYSHGFKMLYELLNPSSIISLNTISLLSFLSLSILYIKNKRSKKKELLFYSPLIIIAILVITRVMVLVPLFNRVPASTYNFLFVFLSLYLFFKIKWKIYPKLKNVIIILIIMFSLLNIPLMGRFEQPPSYNLIEKEMIQSFEIIDGKYVILRGESDFYIKNVIAYLTIYHNIPTIQGNNFIPIGKKISTEVKEMDQFLIDKRCKNLREKLISLDVDYILSFDTNCLILRDCGFNEVHQNEHVCVYKIQ